MKRFHTLFLLVVLAVVAACTGQQARIAPLSGEPVTLAGLTRDFETYEVYYGSRDGSRPSALVFDPKAGDTRIEAGAWSKIESPEALSGILDKLHAWHGGCRLRELKGAKDRFFGYLYYPPNVTVPLRMTGPDSLQVLRLPQPPAGR